MKLSDVKEAIANKKTAYFNGIECAVIGYQVLIEENGNKLYSVALKEKKNKRTVYWVNLERADLTM